MAQIARDATWMRRPGQVSRTGALGPSPLNQREYDMPISAFRSPSEPDEERGGLRAVFRQALQPPGGKLLPGGGGLDDDRSVLRDILQPPQDRADDAFSSLSSLPELTRPSIRTRPGGTSTTGADQSAGGGGYAPPLPDYLPRAPFEDGYLGAAAEDDATDRSNITTPQPGEIDPRTGQIIPPYPGGRPELNTTNPGGTPGLDRPPGSLTTPGDAGTTGGTGTTGGPLPSTLPQRGDTGVLTGFPAELGRSMKHVFGAIASRYPNDRNQIQNIMNDPDFRAWFPNARAVGDDKIDFGGQLSDFDSGVPVNLVDVARGGDDAWQWIDQNFVDDAGGGGVGMQTGGPLQGLEDYAGGSAIADALNADTGLTDSELMLRIQEELQRLLSGQSGGAPRRTRSNLPGANLLGGGADIPIEMLLGGR